VANPPKLAPLFFNIDVFLVGFYPEFFIRADTRLSNSTDVSQAPVSERLQFSFNFIAEQEIQYYTLNSSFGTHAFVYTSLSAVSLSVLFFLEPVNSAK
jgi:hypothetical protein